MMSRRRPNLHKEWTRAAYILMNKFHWSIEQMKSLPLSTFVELQQLIEWEQKETERQKRR